MDSEPDLPTYPAAERNKAPILAVLETVLPRAGTVLEVASGTGQHAVHFARALPGLRWQPSDPDPTVFDVLHERVARAALANLDPPLALDVLEAEWPVESAAAVLCINMIHVSPWAATLGLLDHARALLGTGAPLVLYGPYRRGGQRMTGSNEAFDASLRARNRDWGVRDLEQLTAAGRPRGFVLDAAIEMPANNLTVVLRRRG